jgi:lysophospholipase L1-like esterase
MHRLALAAAVAATALTVAATALTVAATALTVAATPALANTPRDHDHHQAEYYLSLGDSLSAGVQPNTAGQSLPTDRGFTDQLYAKLRRDHRDLRLHKLGCPGDNTNTMINGGICGYSGGDLDSYTADTGSQLAATLAFLGQHRGHVPLITIVVGADNIVPCLYLGTFAKIAACVQQQLPVIQSQLTQILAQLTAADPAATIIGMTYYDVSLASWLTGTAGQTFATQSVALASAFRDLLTGVYQAAGARVADVYNAFETSDMTDQLRLPVIGTVPEDVGLICEWTWMCTPAPQGPNIHATITGYSVIARTFYAALRDDDRDR